ncbi:MAG: hypothetical protein AB7D51_09885 [Desulfovibrionaceae bacterium]
MTPTRTATALAALLLVLAALASQAASQVASQSVSSAASRAEATVFTGFREPTGLAFGPDGTLYVTEWGADRITTLSPSGQRAVFAAGFGSPSGIAVDKAGTVFAASYGGNAVWRMAPDGTRTRIAEGLRTPAGMFLESGGTLLQAERAGGRILRIDPSATGVPEVVARGLELPVAVAMTPGGLAAACWNDTVHLDLLGNRRALEGFQCPGTGLALLEGGALLATDFGGGALRRISPTGEVETVATGLPSPAGLALDRHGRAWVACWGDGSVRRVDLDMAE